MSVKGGPATILSGLVLELDAGNIKSYQSGSITWFDKSGNVNNGTLTNGPTFNTGSLGSIVFDGVDDYVGSFSNYNTYFNFTTSNQFTINCFFKVTTNSNFKAMVVSGNNSGSGFWNYGLWISETNTLFTGFSNVSKYGSTTLVTNQIYQGTLTYSGSVHTLYLNGVNDGVFTNTGLANDSSQGLAIGRKGNASRDYFPGSIYTAQIYNRALSADEVLQNYNATKTRFGL
jgi:hypothetical protein